MKEIKIKINYLKRPPIMLAGGLCKKGDKEYIKTNDNYFGEIEVGSKFPRYEVVK